MFEMAEVGGSPITGGDTDITQFIGGDDDQPSFRKYFGSIVIAVIVILLIVLFVYFHWELLTGKETLEEHINRQTAMISSWFGMKEEGFRGGPRYGGGPHYGGGPRHHGGYYGGGYRGPRYGAPLFGGFPGYSGGWWGLPRTFMPGFFTAFDDDNAGSGVCDGCGICRRFDPFGQTAKCRYCYNYCPMSSVGY